MLLAATASEQVLLVGLAGADPGLLRGAEKGGEPVCCDVLIKQEFEAGAPSGAEGFQAGVQTVKVFVIGGAGSHGQSFAGIVDKWNYASRLVTIQCNPIREDFGMKYDAILVVSFGGPEGMEEVMPFLENVLRGKGVPEERKLEVAHHYELFGGVSPINAQNRELVEQLKQALPAAGVDLPVLLANRNTPPYIPDVMRECMDQGYQKVLVYITSGFSCYSGCRQYRENLMNAQAVLGEGAPEFDKIRVFFNHPLFIETVSDKVAEALDLLPPEQKNGARVVFTAHSIPMAMANTSAYTDQLGEAARLVAERLELNTWDLVYQSRSGPPHVPWLDPDICDHLDALKEQGVPAVVVSPLGFVSDHMEVLFDLDLEARDHAAKLGLGYVRASTPGNDPRMIGMIVELIRERALDLPERRAIGRLPPKHDVCPANCCPAIKRPAAAKAE
jgi:ferrochelatase